MRETPDKNKVFACPMCGITFSNQDVLDRHKHDDIIGKFSISNRSYLEIVKWSLSVPSLFS